MKVHVHDYSGHPFQAELSRELARRGHEVAHSSCDAYASGKGNLVAGPDDTVRFSRIARGRAVAKMRYRRRLLQEIRFGLELGMMLRRERPDVVLLANVPIPMLTVVTVVLAALRVPWVLWHQDVQGVAVRSFAGDRLSSAFALAARAIELAERWCARRAARIVVITEPFLDVHRTWGTADRTTVIANWAPLDEIRPVERKNDWAVEHGLDDSLTLLYAGTLGLKHNPALLPELARRVADTGVPVRLVVVNEGPAEAVLRTEADRLGVPLTLLPFQPYEQLPQVLGSADVLVVLLEPTAGAFSVPSKTLSYLCAGRPVLGLMPAENQAATLLRQAGSRVLPASEESLDAAASWVASVLAEPEIGADLGIRARQLAEREFQLAGAADRFEAILDEAAGEAGT